MAIAGGTIDSVVANEDTTGGVQTTEVVVPGIQTHKLVHRRRFAPQVCFTYHSRISTFLCIGEIRMACCWGWGKWKVSARLKSE